MSMILLQLLYQVLYMFSMYFSFIIYDDIFGTLHPYEIIKYITSHPSNKYLKIETHSFDGRVY